MELILSRSRYANDFGVRRGGGRDATRHFREGVRFGWSWRVIITALPYGLKLAAHALMLQMSTTRTFQLSLRERRFLGSFRSLALLSHFHERTLTSYGIQQARHSSADLTSAATIASVHHLARPSCCSSRSSFSSSPFVVRLTSLTHRFRPFARGQPWFTSATTYNQGGYRGVYKAAGDGIDFFNIQFVLALSFSHPPSSFTTDFPAQLPFLLSLAQIL